MYNTFESPTIRVDLSADDSAVYLKNVQSIMETPYADKVYFFGVCNEIGFLNDIAQKHPEKEYYVPNEISPLDATNISSYQYFQLCNIAKIENLLSDIVIVNIDISSITDADDINKLNNLAMETPKLIILQLISTKTVKNLDFRKFISKIDSLEFDFFFDGLVKPISVIREHPCNAYLCNGQKCHSSKSNFPRYLHVTSKGILPYSARISEISLFKNIAYDYIDFQKYLENQYKNSPEHTLFIDINRHLFQEYVVNQMFEYLPWNIFMEKIYYEKY